MPQGSWGRGGFAAVAASVDGYYLCIGVQVPE